MISLTFRQMSNESRLQNNMSPIVRTHSCFSVSSEIFHFISIQFNPENKEKYGVAFDFNVILARLKICVRLRYWTSINKWMCKCKNFHTTERANKWTDVNEMTTNCDSWTQSTVTHICKCNRYTVAQCLHGKCIRRIHRVCHNPLNETLNVVWVCCVCVCAWTRDVMKRQINSFFLWQSPLKMVGRFSAANFSNRISKFS